MDRHKRIKLLVAVNLLQQGVSVGVDGFVVEKVRPWSKGFRLFTQQAMGNSGFNSHCVSVRSFMFLTRMWCC